MTTHMQMFPVVYILKSFSAILSLIRVCNTTVECIIPFIYDKLLLNFSSDTDVHSQLD